MRVEQIPLEMVRPHMRAGRREHLLFSHPERLTFYGGFVDGVLVGFAGLLFDGATCWFKNAYVLPEHRRRGYYRRLFDARVEVCLARRVRVIRAYATPLSLPMFLARGGVAGRARGRSTYVRIVP